MEKTTPEIQVGKDFESMLGDLVGRSFPGKSDAVPACCVCGTSNMTRYGRTAAGTQRWKCSDCGKVSTGGRTGRILANTKLGYSVWMRFIPLFLERASCDRVATVLGVCHKTAWFMRVRMLEAVFEELPAFKVGEDTGLGIGRMFFRGSHKGRHVDASAETEGTGVITAVDGRDGFLYDVSCRGKVTAGHAGASVLKCIRSGAITGTDGDAPSGTVIGRIMTAIPAAVTGRDEGEVAGIRGRIRGFMAPFHGVSTRWLHIYLAWFKWIFSFGESVITGTEHMRAGDYVHTWMEISGRAAA